MEEKHPKCPRCSEMHRRAQKAESALANTFKQHNPVLAEIESTANLLKDYAGRLRRLYRSEWRQFQVDDPLFKEMYGKYLTRSGLLEELKRFFRGKK